MNINNDKFWSYWEAGKYEEAFNCSIDTETFDLDERINFIVKKEAEQNKQTKFINIISAGEFLYDYIMINPKVVTGIDFARSDDLSSLFSLSEFAQDINLTTTTGDMAQLQGYVAEQYIAAELQNMGYDVEFPDSSNNPGWDILVDGQQFQVKSLGDPQGVKTHLETYPDIPVYVNNELAANFEGNPQVYVSNISKDKVDEAVHSTLHHASDLTNFEIPVITLGISSISNAVKVLKNDTVLSQAVVNVISDTSSRIVLTAIGKTTGVMTATLLFGPAGGVVGAAIGTYAFNSQGGKISTKIRRLKSKKLEHEIILSLDALIRTVNDQIDYKILIKKRKSKIVSEKIDNSSASQAVENEIGFQYKAEKKYLLNKKDELLEIISSVQKGKVFVLDVIDDTISIIAKSRVHPFHFQAELNDIKERIDYYCKRI